MQLLEKPFSLDGKIALVTGGGTGLGLAMASCLAASGAKVVITGRREDVLKAACAEIGHGATYRTHDVAACETTAALVEGIEKEIGEIDILVNNAGINYKKVITEMPDEDFQRVVQTNLNGLFAMTREVVRFMQPRKRGSIINIASMAAMYGIPKAIGYSASKSAVLGMTRALATELGPDMVRVNSISPGFIYSEMTSTALNSDPERKAKVFNRTPMGIMGQPEDIGWAAVYLASDAAKFVTGANFAIDGGNSIGF